MAVKRTDNSERFLERQRKAIARALLSTTELMATKVQDLTPVKSGNLKANIIPKGKIEVIGTKYRSGITTAVGYAPYVEFGTKFMAPRAMFRRGIKNNLALFKKTFEAIVKAL